MKLGSMRHCSPRREEGGEGVGYPTMLCRVLCKGEEWAGEGTMVRCSTLTYRVLRRGVEGGAGMGGVFIGVCLSHLTPFVAVFGLFGCMFLRAHTGKKEIPRECVFFLFVYMINYLSHTRAHLRRC